MINLRDWYNKNIFMSAEGFTILNEDRQEITVEYKDYYKYEVLKFSPATGFEDMK